MSSRLLVPLGVLSLLLLAPRQASAQITTEAVCAASFSWMNNAQKQSPCLVASYLQGVCASNEWDVPSLPQGEMYSPPTEDEENPCQCSAVVYNLLAACEACQGAAWDTWTLWTFNCTSSDTTLPPFPLAVPSNTSVPGWANINPSVEGTFNVTAAHLFEENPPSTTSTTTSTPTSTPTPTPTPTATPTTSLSSSPTQPIPTTPLPTETNSGSSGSSTPVGAIVGGVIGGLAALGGIIALIVWIVMRNGRGGSTPQTANFTTAPMSPVSPSSQFTPQYSPNYPTHPPSMYGNGGMPATAFPPSPAFPPPSPAFPSPSPAQTNYTGQTTQTGQSMQSSNQAFLTHPQQQPQGYHGLAEF